MLPGLRRPREESDFISLADAIAVGLERRARATEMSSRSSPRWTIWCARAAAWSATTMSDVAKAAGVSRQTVYNEFGSRPELIQAYVVREIETLIGEVEIRVRGSAGDARRALSEAFSLFLKLASDEPLGAVMIVADAEGGEVIRLLTDTGRSIATDRVGALIHEVWPQITLTDARLLADSMARLAISHALPPTEENRIKTAASVTADVRAVPRRTAGLTRELRFG